MQSDTPEISHLNELLHEVIGDGLPHERKKAIMLTLHAAKTFSRQENRAELTLNLLDIEECLGFGKQDHVIDTERLEALANQLVALAANDAEDPSLPTTELPFEIQEEPTESESQQMQSLAIELTLCNCNNRDEAREIAHGLVESGLAACVNIIANIGSVYRWQGEVVDTSECQLQIKSAPERRTAIQAYITEHHANDIPEIISVPINTGNVDYLAWVLETTNVETD